jgi:CubicO group peptidase (beta-lactamase class C family)
MAVPTGRELGIAFMRRILVGLTFAALVLVSVATGIVAADWPFWRRVIELPRDPGEWPESFFKPVTRIDGANGSFFPGATPQELSIDPAALESAARWAMANNSVALLVLHRGRVQMERYFGEMTAQALFSGRAMTRSLLGMTYGIALQERKIDSLDAPIEQYLTEWRNDERGRITIRQLLWNVSGLEEEPLDAAPPRGSALDWWLQLPTLATAKNSRLSLGNDFAAAALRFAHQHDPGLRFNFSNANAQLAGIILERATGVPYERYVEQRLWQRIGAGPAEFYMDREDGMPAVYCCFRAAPRDYLRLGALLISDGASGSTQVLPPGWVQQMATGSQVNPRYGLQIWTGQAPAGVREYTPGSGRGVRHGEAYLADDVIWMEGGGGRTIWAVPSQQLVIVRLGRQSPSWDASVLPNTLLRGIRN